jgi:putative PIN family toxin of toxin-antitoxin system
MRAVLDTNILARAARGGPGLAAEIVRMLTAEPHVLILSPFLIAELARVLRYERMRVVHGLDDEGIDAYVQRVQSGALVVDPPEAAPAAVVPHDPEDDPVLATAIAAQAEVLCTLDRHFRHPDVGAYCTGHGLRVVSDLELLEQLRSEVPPPA